MALIDGGSKNGFPEPTPLKILEIGDGLDHRNENMVYSVEKPHPGYGRDPNILNEMGHSVYPKMVYPNGNSQPGFVVNNEKEEAEQMGNTTKVEDPDGPTIERYVAAGFKASTYPPKGYKAVSTKEEVDKFIKIEKDTAAPWG